MIELGRDANGKRMRKSVTVKGNKSDAQRKLRELLTNLDKGIPIDESKKTVGEFLDQWLDTYAKTNTSPKTYYDYSGMIRRYLKPVIGHIPLKKLNPQMVQQLHASMYEKGLSARTVQYAHKILKHSLKHAVRWEMLARNVCDLVDSPKGKSKEMLALDINDVQKLLNATSGSTYGHIFHLAVYTGLRRGELLALRWCDVDLKSKNLSINQSLCTVRGNGVITSNPKTSSSRRQVSLPPSAAGLLKSIKATRMEQYEAIELEWDESAYIFLRPDGSPMRPDTVTHAFIRIARELGFADVRFHDLRHTHATLMLKQGVHPKIVSERLGHASVNITMDTYSHVLPGMQEEAAVVFEKSLGNIIPEAKANLF